MKVSLKMINAIRTGGGKPAPLPIYVGDDAVSYADDWTYTYTIVELANPLNLTGLLTTLKTYTELGLTAVKIGMFYQVGDSTHLTCRGYVTLSSIATHYSENAISLAGVAGDLLGFYYTAGAFCSQLTGGPGMLYLSGDHFNANNTNFSLASGRRLSANAVGLAS